MKTRRALLLGMVGSFAGSTLFASSGRAFVIEEMPPHVADALTAACRPLADDHAGLLSVARGDLVARIAQGLLPAGASEQVGCPVCGCSFVVTADDTP